MSMPSVSSLRWHTYTALDVRSTFHHQSTGTVAILVLSNDRPSKLFVSEDDTGVEDVPGVYGEHDHGTVKDV